MEDPKPVYKDGILIGYTYDGKSMTSVKKGAKEVFGENKKLIGITYDGKTMEELSGMSVDKEGSLTEGIKEAPKGLAKQLFGGLPKQPEQEPSNLTLTGERVDDIPTVTIDSETEQKKPGQKIDVPSFAPALQKGVVDKTAGIWDGALQPKGGSLGNVDLKNPIVEGEKKQADRINKIFNGNGTFEDFRELLETRPKDFEMVAKNIAPEVKKEEVNAAYETPGAQKDALLFRVEQAYKNKIHNGILENARAGRQEVANKVGENLGSASKFTGQPYVMPENFEQAKKILDDINGKKEAMAQYFDKTGGSLNQKVRESEKFNAEIKEGEKILPYLQDMIGGYILQQESQANPNVSPYEVGEKIYALTNPKEYAIWKDMGGNKPYGVVGRNDVRETPKAADAINRQMTMLGMQAFYNYGNKEAISRAADAGQDLNWKFTLPLEEQTKHMIAARLNEKGIKPNKATDEQKDEVAETLPELNRNTWFDINKNENNDNLPSTGFGYSIGKSYHNTIEDAVKTAFGWVIPNKERETALDVGQQMTSSDVLGENPESRARLDQLKQKEKEGKLTDSEIQEKKNLEQYTGVRSWGDRTFDLLGGGVGQFAGFGTIAAFTGGLSNAATVPQAIKALISPAAGKGGMLAAGYLMSREQNAREAEQLFPDSDDGLKKFLYTETASAIDTFVERIFPEEKFLSGLAKKEIAGLIPKLTAKNIRSELNESLAKKIAKNVVAKIVEQQKTPVQEGLEETISAGLKGMFQGILNPEDTNPITTEELINTATQAYFSSQLLGLPKGVMATRNPHVPLNAIWDAASNPDAYYGAKAKIIELKNEGELTEAEANGRISLLNTAQKNYNDNPILSGNMGGLTLPQKQNYLARLTNEEVLQKKADEATDENVKRTYNEEISESKKIRKQMYDGEIEVTDRNQEVEKKEVVEDFTPEETSAIAEIQKKEFTALKPYTDIIKDEKSTPEQKREALKGISDQLLATASAERAGTELGQKLSTVIESLGHEAPKESEALKASLRENEEPDITVEEMIDKPGIYKGQRGMFKQDGQAIVFKVEGQPKEYELGNVDEVKGKSISDYGIENEETVVSADDAGNITVRGEAYKNNYSDPFSAVNYDKEGNVVSVNLETPEGKKRTFRGNIAEDLAYQIHLKEITKDNETREIFEQHINEDAGIQKEMEDRGLSEVAPPVATEGNESVSREKIEPVVAEAEQPTSTPEEKNKIQEEILKEKTLEDALGKAEDYADADPTEQMTIDQAKQEIKNKWGKEKPTSSKGEEVGGKEADLEGNEKGVTSPRYGKADENITSKEDKGTSDNIQTTTEESPEKLNKRYERVTDQHDFTDPYDVAVKYFADGGKINPSELERIFGGKGDKGARISLMKNNAGTVDKIAHYLWESDQTGRYTTEHYVDAIESALRDFPSQSAMKKDIADRWDLEGAYEKHKLQQGGQNDIDVVEKMTDEEINHLLQLDAENSPDIYKLYDDIIEKNNQQNKQGNQSSEEGGVADPPKSPTEKIEEGDEENNRQRKFTKQMLASEDLSEEAKEGIAKTLDYVRQTNEMTVAEAEKVIKQVGVDEAQNLVMTDGELKPVVRVTVGMILIKKYNELAAKATDQETKDFYYDKAIQTATFVTEKLGTEPGQMIQAFSLWSRLSPEAQLRAAAKDVKQQYAKKVKKRKPDIDKLGGDLQKANEEAAEELTKSKKIKASVDKAEKSGIQKAKDKATKAKDKRKKLLDKYKGNKGGGLTLSSGGLTKEGIEYVGELVKTYLDEGLANLEVIARNVAKHLKDIGANVTDDVQKNVGDIIREQLEASANTKIIKSLSELEKEVGKIIRSHYAVPLVQGESLKQKLINDAGLEGKEAEDLANEIQKEFDAIATRKKEEILFRERARIDKIQHDLDRGKKKTRKEVQDDIIKYSNLGAFSKEDFFDFLSKKLNLGTLTAAEAKEIERLAKLIEKAPEGSPKNDATQDLLKYRANMKGVSLMEATQAVWYANILSGHKTHIVNIVSTFFNGAAFFASEAIRSPRSIPVLIYGAARGLRRGGFEAYHTLMTGRSPIHISKIETPGTLERIKFIGGWFNPGNYLKFVGRMMVAEDVLQFQALKEMRATQLAYKEARLLGEKNPFSKKTWKIIEEKLLNTKERSDAAKAQAEEEGLKSKSAGWKRRIYELMELNRDIQMTEEAYGFAAEGTFNHQPEGTLGALNNGISSMLDLTIGGARPLRFFVPFTRIITNVVNNALNFTPVGFIRAARGQRGFESFDRGIFKGAYKELTPEQRKQLVAKASLGVALTGGLYALTKIPCKDGHNVLEITGGGTGDYGKDAQLKQTGWQPYSIRACGGSYVSYKFTPLVFNLAYIGYMNDNEKYGKDSDATMFRKISGAMYQTGQLALDGTWVGSTSDLMETISSSTPSKLAGNIEKTVTKMAAQIVVPNYYLQGAQQTEEWMNLSQKDARTQFDRIKQHVPVVRNSMNDKINALGEPIKTDVDIFVSEHKPHKVFDYLNEKGVWVGTVNPNTFMIYDPDTDEERKGTADEFYKFSKLRGDKIKSELELIIDSGVDYSKEELKKAIRVISANATKAAKAELYFGDWE